MDAEMASQSDAGPLGLHAEKAPAQIKFRDVIHPRL